MSPFDLAQSLGFGKKDILKFLSKANPEISKGLTNAIGLGYSSDQVFKFLSKSMSGARVDPKVSRRVFGDPSASNIMRRAQNVPSQQSAGQIPIIGGLVGAGVGFAAGGPAGALVGGAAGYNQLNKLAKAYEGHIQSGGSIPFASFVTELAKGTALAGLSASQIDKLKDAAKGYIASTGKEGEAPATPEISTDSELAKQPVSQESPVETPEVPQETEVSSESYDIFKERGVDRIIDSFATQITPEQGISGLRKLFGPQYIKDIERQAKKPIEEVLSEAFDYSKSKGGVGGRSSFVEKEPIDFSSLPRPVQNRVRLINQQIESLEKKGVPYEGKRMQKLLNKRKQLMEGEGLSFLEQEEVRLEKGKPQEEIKAEPLEKPKSEALMSIFKKPKEGVKKITGKSIRPMEGSQKSSNVIGTFYDPDTKEMRAVFGSGSVYTYPDVDMEDFQSVVGGKARPITEGENTLGFWHRRKDPSIGAAFSKFIKKQAEKYPATKLSPEQYKVGEKQILEAKRTFDASDLFEPFRKERKKGRQREKGKALREMEPVLKDIDDDFLTDIVSYMEEQLSSKLKNPPTVSRLQKEFRKEFL